VIALITIAMLNAQNLTFAVIYFAQYAIRFKFSDKGANQCVENISEVMRPMKEELKEISTHQIQHQLQTELYSKGFHMIIE